MGTAKTRRGNPARNASHSHTTHAKRKPAKPQCFRWFCGRGRRTLSRLPPRVLPPVGSAKHRPRREQKLVPQSAAGARSPLGMRFGSGCEKTRWGAEEARCRPVLLDKSGNSGVGLVLRGKLLQKANLSFSYSCDPLRRFRYSNGVQPFTSRKSLVK